MSENAGTDIPDPAATTPPVQPEVSASDHFSSLFTSTPASPPDWMAPPTTPVVAGPPLVSEQPAFPIPPAPDFRPVFDDEPVPAATAMPPVALAEPETLPVRAGGFDFLLETEKPAPDLAAQAQRARVDIPPMTTHPGTLGLERHSYADDAPKTDVLDWVALVLSVLIAPVGVLVAIVAMVLGNRNRGYVATVAKIALAVGLVMCVGLGVGGFVVNNLDQKQAAHEAVVASSGKWCTALTSSGDLTSPTYGFPTEQDTIADSVAAVQKYQAFWTSLTNLAPAGIKAGTRSIATAAGTIITSVNSSQTFDDTTNATQMQSAIATSGIGSWVSNYCN